MKIDMQQIKLGAGVLAAVAVVGVGAYWYSASTHKPHIVTISQSGTGVTSGAVFGVPLSTLTLAAPGVPVSFGPLEGHPDVGAVNLKFDAGVDGTGREVTMVNGDLLLPVTFGRNSQVPERITVTYRNNNLNSVRYQGKSGGVTFNVTHSLAVADVGELEDGETAVQ